MTKQIIRHRWLIVVGAVLIQLALGSIYAWSVFTVALVEAGWSKTQTQLVFSLCLAVFAVVMVFAGRSMNKIGSRKLAISGGITLGLGYFLAGLLGAENFVSTLVLVGIVGGAGIGLAYSVPIAVGMRWFPDKKGLITGLAVAGFGFGATLWMTLADSLGGLVGGRFLSLFGLSSTFMIFGLLFALMVIVSGVLMVFPPANWKPSSTDKVLSAQEKIAKMATKICNQAELCGSQLLKTSQFYLITTTFVISSSAGLMSIGLMRLWPQEALVKNGMSLEEAGMISTLAMAVFFALLNGLGRIVWGSISDKIGSKKSLIIMLASQGLFVLAFQWLAGNVYSLFLLSMLIGFNFGGNFSLFPTITADTFGTKNVGQNYGWVFLAYAVGGIFGPILGGWLGDMGNFPLAFSICGLFCFVGVGTIGAVKSA